MWRINAYPKSDCELSSGHDILFTEGNDEIPTNEIL